MAAKAKPASSAPPPPSPPSPPSPLPAAAAQKGFLRRVLPFLLTANLAVGVYVLLRTSNKEPSEEAEEAAGKVPAIPVATVDKKPVDEPIPQPIKVLPPIAEQEQRELFKWILEEKRKVKPSDRLEKNKIDEEKALLKQFIRANSIPSI